MFTNFFKTNINCNFCAAEAEELPAKKLSQPCVIGNEEFSDFENQLISSSSVEGNGFVAVISLHDANTLYVSSGISASLGYPQDMLVGQVCVFPFHFENE